jgi:photosystem II stability/assembly factor-like uncharacterized protein
MKRLAFLGILFLLLGGIGLGLYFNPDAVAEIKEKFIGNDPDMPSFLRTETETPREDFMISRAENIALYRGISKDEPFDPQKRIDAIKQLEQKEAELARTSAPQAVWTEIGPAPIPLGQTDTTRANVSGRTTAIAVHPTNPNIVYAGTAQGGVYRSTDGGTNWTPILDAAQSLAVGAIAIAPSQPETIYVGTGEPNFAADAFYGVGVYRIDNASTTATLSGPLGGAQFNGRAIGEILVHPTDPATIFVGSTSGTGGFFQSGATPTGPLPNRGLYRSTNATTTATFSQINLTGAAENLSVRDIVIDPLNPDFLVAWQVAGGGGIFVTGNALAATPTFTHPVSVTGATTGDVNGELAIYHVSGQPNPVVYAGTGNGGGRVLRSTDGGVTFPQRIDNDFCGGQCFYNIAIAASPTNTNPDNDRVYIGGQVDPIFAFSADGGATFTNSQEMLHADTHVITVAPSSASTIYFGSDGGIAKSTDSGANWTPLNNSQYSATQFISMDLHPTDQNFTIGGTQDNGTQLRLADGSWTHADDGDGGFSVIDRNAADTSSVRMYHTYFNQPDAMGYAITPTTATAQPNLWTFHGCGFLGAIPNGMTCTATACLFYAPLERGPGSPLNTLYFGSDVLYRSTDGGLTMTKVSQEPIGGAVSAIGISPQNDNVRLVGTSSGGVFGTSTGANPLTNLDPSNVIPNNFVARAVIDPQSPTTAYITLAAYGVVNVWKTTTLSSFADRSAKGKTSETENLLPTWTPANNGLPLVPVNALVVDPLDSNRLYAGTDIGAYVSHDAGANWLPFGTGLPRVAIFDIGITGGAANNRIVKVATHGRGVWQIQALVPSAANVSVSGRVTANGSGVSRSTITMTDAQGNPRRAITNAFGYYRFDEVAVGQTCVIQAVSKKYHFAPQVVFVENDTNVDFAPFDSPFIESPIKGRR